MKDSADEKGIWGQIEEMLVEEDLRRAIVGLLYKLYKKRPERFQKYEELGNIPSKDMVQLLGEYSEMVLGELKAQGGPTKAPIEVTKAAEEILKTIINLYGEDEENNRRKAPLYPHVPRRQEPLFPHTRDKRRK